MWQLLFQFVAAPIPVFRVSTYLINTAERNHLLLTLTTKGTPICSRTAQPIADQQSREVQINPISWDFHSSGKRGTTGGKQHGSSSCGELQRVNSSQIKHRSSRGSKGAKEQQDQFQTDSRAVAAGEGDVAGGGRRWSCGWRGAAGERWSAGMDLRLSIGEEEDGGR